MKVIKYSIVMESNVTTPEKEEKVKTRYLAQMRCNDADLSVSLSTVRSVAVGEVTVEDVPDEPHVPSAEEQLRADIDYLALMGGVVL